MVLQAVDRLGDAKWSSFADYLRGSSYAGFPQEHRSSPGKLRCSLVLAELGPHTYRDPDVPDLVISSPLEIITPGETAWNFGNGWSRSTWTPGSLFVLPPHLASDWRADCVRKVLLLIVPTATLRRVFGVSAPANLQAAFAPLAEDIWEDAFLQSLLVRMWETSDRNRNTDYLLSDGLLTTILSVLLQRATNFDLPRKIALSPFKLKRVVQFVEERLEQDIDVKDLAAIAELSSRHFGRVFSLEVGMSPHHWLMQKRLDRAKELLLLSDLDCASIAEKCGFASQSHLTFAMKRHVGATPVNYRRENRPF